MKKCGYDGCEEQIQDQYNYCFACNLKAKKENTQINAQNEIAEQLRSISLNIAKRNLIEQMRTAINIIKYGDTTFGQQLYDEAKTTLQEKFLKKEDKKLL